MLKPMLKMDSNQKLSKPLTRAQSLWGVYAFDFLVFFFFSLTWILCLTGGVRWEGRSYLTHSADLRRFVFFLVGALYLVFYSSRQTLQKKSYFLKFVFKVFEGLKSLKVQLGTLFCACLVASYISYLQALALHFPMYDVGIFHQILWSLGHGLGFHSTISGAGNFLNDHLSLSLVGLVPFFKLFRESPFFLPIFQPFAIFGGASAWLYLANHFPKASIKTRTHLSVATLVFILSFDSLWKNISWGFHENAIGFLCLSWAFAFIITERASKFLVLFLFLVAAFSKEILLLDVAVILICWSWLNWRKKSRNFATVLVAISLVLVLSFIYFETMPHPADKNYFGRYYSYLGTDLGSFSRALFQTPIRVIQTIGAGELLRYVWRVFSPWLFLPLVAFRGPFWIVGVLPSFASAALASYYALRRPEYHYVLELWPILGTLTVVFLARKKSVSLIWIWAFFSLFRMDYDPVGAWRSYREEALEMAPLREELLKISPEAKVLSDEISGPWLAGRKYISRWPDTSLLPDGCPDFIVAKHSDSGTLNERGVSNLLIQCGKHSSDKVYKQRLNSQGPVPEWKQKIWSGYQIR